jgi:hypothetical protein
VANHLAASANERARECGERRDGGIVSAFTFCAILLGNRELTFICLCSYNGVKAIEQTGLQIRKTDALHINGMFFS